MVSLLCRSQNAFCASLCFFAASFASRSKENQKKLRPFLLTATLRYGVRTYAHSTHAPIEHARYRVQSHRVTLRFRNVGVNVAKLDRVDVFIVIEVDILPPAHAELEAL